MSAEGPPLRRRRRAGRSRADDAEGGAAPEERCRCVAYFCKRGRRGHGRTIVEGFLAAGVVEEELAYPVTVEIPSDDPGYHAALADFYDASAAAPRGASRRRAATSSSCRRATPSSTARSCRSSTASPAEYETEVVAGVSGMAGCWTRARTPITYGDDVLAVLPGTLSAEALKAHLVARRRRRDHEARPQFREGAQQRSRSSASPRAPSMSSAARWRARRSCRCLPPTTRARPISPMILVPGQGRCL